MLYAFAHPRALVGLLLGFVVGLLAHGVARAWAQSAVGDRMELAYGRGRPDIRRHIDPFGAIAAAIGGVGWGAPAPGDRSWPRRERARRSLALLAGPLANFALAAAGFAAFRAGGGSFLTLAYLHLSDGLHGQILGPFGQLTALLFAMENLAMGVLSFIPLPPLEGSIVMFELAPRTPGWQRARYRLVEQNWGVGILLFLLALPLSAQGPLLLLVLNAIVDPILTLISHLG